MLYSILPIIALSAAAGVRAQGQSQQSSGSAAQTVSVATSTGAPVAVGGSSSVTSYSGLPETAALGPQGYQIPPLASLTSGAPSASTVGLDTTYSVGAQPTKVTGAGAVPLPTLPAPANYPALDVSPPVDSPEVQGWLASINLSGVPTFNRTTGACATDPQAVADKSRCWWTCGGCTRETDITTCPDKYTWGVSFDDGPSPYTPLLLDYLNEKDITTTFFVVGSRVISRPAMLQSEYMAGHQISVHTWSHSPLTTLTNEQIVAELGWTKKVIKDTIGVTPNTFRPPYGDIDDRVRYVAAQMGLTPIIWTSVNNNGVFTEFDTTDWNIPGGTATGPSSLAKFNNILSLAANMSTGFILLSHDLYQETVDLAVGYLLPEALAADSPYTLKSIIECQNKPLSEAYVETAQNLTETMMSSPTGSSVAFQPVVSGSAGSMASSASAGASGSAAGARPSGGANARAELGYAGGFIAVAAAIVLAY